MTGPMHRRDFLGRTALTGAAAAASLTAARGWAAEDAPSKQVTIGVMGLERGKALATGFARQPGCVVKYACDVDIQRAQAGAKAVADISGDAPEAIQDFRKILDDPEIDALIVAAPNHWHAPATILGCDAGKHVYVEKPCSHNPREGELMVEAARKHKKAVQMGSQRRSSEAQQELMAMLKDGIIGRVYHARTFYNNARGSIGHAEPSAAPGHIDYDLWQGPAPHKPFKSNVVHYNWHWFWHWGNGELGNNGVHALDLARWGLGVDYPIKVTSLGGRYVYEDDQETPDTQTVAYEFPGKISCTWEGLSCNRYGNAFVTFYGTEGAVDVFGNSSFKVYDPAKKLVKEVDGNNGDAEHLHDFLSAIRDDKPTRLNAEIAEGHKSTLLCHLGNIAQRTGRALECNPQNGHIEGDSEAMELWTRQYEHGWDPKV